MELHFWVILVLVIRSVCQPGTFDKTTEVEGEDSVKFDPAERGAETRPEGTEELTY